MSQSCHQSYVWIVDTGDTSIRMMLIPQLSALAFGIKMSEKCIYTSPSAMQVKNQ
jgi:hypothetical protein